MRENERISARRQLQWFADGLMPRIGPVDVSSWIIPEVTLEMVEVAFNYGLVI